MPKLKPMFERLVRRDAEAGQAIVIVALFMLVLVGMLGLAIDGGGLFLLYRDARNAADTAALQAAYARCTSPVGSPEYKTVGLNAADENGFRNGAISTVTVDDYSLTTGDQSDQGKVYINITATKPSYFAQLVFTGPLTIEVDAVAFCDRGFDPESNPGALARADDSACPQSGAAQEWNFTGAEIYFDGVLYTNGSFGQSVKTWLNEDSHIYYYGELKESQDWRVAPNKDVLDDPDKNDDPPYPLATRGQAGAGIDEEDYHIFDLDPDGTQNPEPPGSTTEFADYAPGGAVFEYLSNYDETATPGGRRGYAFAYTPPSGKLQNITELPPEAIDSNGYVRGLIYVNGDVALTGNALNNYTPDVNDTWVYTEDSDSFGNSPDWDENDFLDAFRGNTTDSGTPADPSDDITDQYWEGVTFVATGTISVGLNGRFVRFYDGLNGFEGSAGLADEISTQRDYSKILFASDVEGYGCNNSSNAIGFGNGGFAYGFLWAPRARIDLSFSSADFRGAMDAWTVSYSGSTSRFWYDPSLIAPRNPSTGQEK